MRYDHYTVDFFDKQLHDHKDKVKRARKNLAIVCWAILGFGIAAIGFFGWIIYWALSHMGK